MMGLRLDLTILHGMRKGMLNAVVLNAVVFIPSRCSFRNGFKISQFNIILVNGSFQKLES